MTRQQFIEAVAQEQESLRRFLRLLCEGDGALADDIAQEALLKAYLSFERFEGRARFSTWLFRIAYNCFYDNASRVSRCPTVSLDDLDATSEDGICRQARNVMDESMESDKRFDNQVLYHAIRGLPDTEQAVILLFYMEDKSIKDIETITGMPSGTVRSHLSRARAHLKLYLEKNR
ncbi:MAG: RNA polymerase sigma factor [Candidatus Cryptobacteroides sp.]